MDRALVHFEVFARPRGNAPFALHFATEDRGRAIEVAEELLSLGRAAAVRVTKETLDPESKEFRSINILTKGDIMPEPKRVRKLEPAGTPCVAPQDLYSAHARERIGRLLDAWLRRRSVTAFELLHRPDLAEALDASGVELQHAVQKIAIPEAQALGLSTHEVIRTFQKLIERAIERVIKDGKSRAFPTIGDGNFAALATRLAEEETERQYILGGGVARFLAPAKTWSEKVSLILDLADAAPEGGRARALALSVLEQPLAEILSSHGALSDLVGGGLDLGGNLAALTRLVAGEAVRRTIVFDPNLERILPPLSGGAARLSEWLQTESFSHVRHGLARRILRELRGPRRLRPSDPDGEIALLRGLAMALTAASGQLVDLEDVQETFIERSRGLIGADFVNTFVQGRESALAEVQALVRLAENVAGPLNKRAAGQWILAAVGAMRFEKEARFGFDAPAARLAALAALQRSITRTGVAEADVEEINVRIGAVGGWIEKDANLCVLVARSSAPAHFRLSLLLRMASGETAPRGPAADKARTEAVKLLRAPDARSELARTPSALEGLKALIAQAGLAA